MSQRFAPLLDRMVSTQVFVPELLFLTHRLRMKDYFDRFPQVRGYVARMRTKIDMCRAHFEKVGLGADYVKKFIR